MNWERFYSQTSRGLAAQVRKAIALSSTEAEKLPPTGLEGDTPVTIECYGKTERWNSRYLAYHFYLTGAEQCDGSEANRYYLIAGRIRFDNEDWVSDSDNYYERKSA